MTLHHWVVQDSRNWNPCRQRLQPNLDSGLVISRRQNFASYTQSDSDFIKNCSWVARHNRVESTNQNIIAPTKVALSHCLFCFITTPVHSWGLPYSGWSTNIQNLFGLFRFSVASSWQDHSLEGFSDVVDVTLESRRIYSAYLWDQPVHVQILKMILAYSEHLSLSWFHHNRCSCSEWACKGRVFVLSIFSPWIGLNALLPFQSIWGRGRRTGLFSRRQPLSPLVMKPSSAPGDPTSATGKASISAFLASWLELTAWVRPSMHLKGDSSWESSWPVSAWNLVHLVPAVAIVLSDSERATSDRPRDGLILEREVEEDEGHNSGKLERCRWDTPSYMRMFTT